MSAKKSDLTLKDSMEKISHALGTSFIEDVEKINKQIATIEEKKNEITTKSIDDSNSLILADQIELRDGLKALIKMNTEVMETLKSNIRIGSQPYESQVFSLLVSSLTNAFRELRELNQYITDTKIKTNQMGFGDMKKSDTIELTTNQLSDMLTKARENNSMNEIKVDFQIE